MRPSFAYFTQKSSLRFEKTHPTKNIFQKFLNITAFFLQEQRLKIKRSLSKIKMEATLKYYKNVHTLMSLTLRVPAPCKEL